MRRLLGLLCAAVCAAVVPLATAPKGGAVGAPWFAPSVGNATQVVSVVGVGGSNAKLDVYQRAPTGWQPVAAGIPAHVGSAGLAPAGQERLSGYADGGLRACRSRSGPHPIPVAACNTSRSGPTTGGTAMTAAPPSTRCRSARRLSARLDTAASENLQIPQYKHAVVMGVNPNRAPGKGAAFSSTPPTAARPKGAWRSTTPRWCRSSSGCGPAR